MIMALVTMAPKLKPSGRRQLKILWIGVCVCVCLSVCLSMRARVCVCVCVGGMGGGEGRGVQSCIFELAKRLDRLRNSLK